VKQIIIGIQCRSTSQRLPGKCFLEIGGTSIIKKVVDTCHQTSKYLNGLPKYDVYCRPVLLVPHGDHQLIDHMKNQVMIFEGDEDDVLGRYAGAAKLYRADYIVRITGDCFYIPSHTISRHVKRILRRPADYVNNVLFRCQPEGWDCEVLSHELLRWLADNAVDADDREHVTTYIRKSLENGTFPRDLFRIATATDHFDFSAVKTSIDTFDDYLAALAEFDERKKKNEECLKIGSLF
jgi:spore coat polysaccharide biosynthesis protein SpsF